MHKSKMLVHRTSIEKKNNVINGPQLYLYVYLESITQTKSQLFV